MFELIGLLLSCVLAEVASADAKLVRAQARNVPAIGVVGDPAVAISICMRLIQVRKPHKHRTNFARRRSGRARKETYIAVEVEETMSKSFLAANDNLHLARSDVHVRVEAVRSTTLVYEYRE